MLDDGEWYDPLDFPSFADEGMSTARTEMAESNSSEGLILLDRVIAKHPHLGSLLGLQYRFLRRPLIPEAVGTAAAAKADLAKRRAAGAVADELIHEDVVAGLYWHTARREIVAWSWKRADDQRTPLPKARKRGRGLYREVVHALYVILLRDQPGINRAEATRRISPVLQPFFQKKRCEPGDGGSLYQMLRTIEKHDLPAKKG